MIKLQEMATEKENIEQSINKIRDHVENKRINVTKLASTSLTLKSQADELESNKQLNDSRTAYAVSLYATVTGIEWDYSAPSHVLAGRTSINYSYHLSISCFSYFYEKI